MEAKKASVLEVPVKATELAGKAKSPVSEEINLRVTNFNARWQELQDKNDALRRRFQDALNNYKTFTG